MPRKAQPPQRQEMERLSVYSRILERHGFPTIMCLALIFALNTLYADIKEVAVQQIKQTIESVSLQREMLTQLKETLTQLKEIQRSAEAAHMRASVANSSSKKGAE